MRTWWLALALAGCQTEKIKPQFEVRPLSLNLPPVAWIDTEQPWTTISILNTTYFDLELTSAQIIANVDEGADTDGEVDVVATATDFLELGDISSEARQIAIRDSTEVQIRVAPADASALATWSDARFQATLRLVIGGTGVIDPITNEPDMDEWQEEGVDIPVFMETRCDLDGDAYEARECGGNDCDDFLKLVNIEAIEDCDGFDNNCNGVEDENCPDLDL